MEQCEKFLEELKQKGNIYKGVPVVAYIHPANVFLKIDNEIVLRPLNSNDDIGAGRGGILFLNISKTNQNATD
jgi:hypothetical protein